jgi:glycosyltransferase involved in cell wall biosynthesis
MLRVLLIGDHFGYAAGVAHGVTSYYLNVLPALFATGVSILPCFLRGAHPLARQLLDAGIEIRFLNGGKWSPWVFAQVLGLAREYQPHIVHTIGMKACLAGRLAARATNAANLIHVHDFVRPPLPIRWLYRAVASPSDVGISVSSAVADYVPATYHLARERSAVLHNAIDLRRFKSVQDAGANRQRLLQLDAATPVLGMLGRFHPVKGQAEMLEIFAKVVRAIPSARLVLVGDGPTRAEIEQKAAAAGLAEKILFLGQRKDIPQLMGCFDVLAIPSRSEGLSIAAMEAMAVGRPVVAFRVGGVGDVVHHGKTGYLVEPGNIEGFADAVVSLLSDAQRRSDFGACAADISQRFDIPGHVGRLVGVYRRLLDPACRRGPFRTEEAFEHGRARAHQGEDAARTPS